MAISVTCFTQSDRELSISQKFFSDGVVKGKLIAVILSDYVTACELNSRFRLAPVSASSCSCCIFSFLLTTYIFNLLHTIHIKLPMCWSEWIYLNWSVPDIVWQVSNFPPPLIWSRIKRACILKLMYVNCRPLISEIRDLPKNRNALLFE